MHQQDAAAGLIQPVQDQRALRVGCHRYPVGGPEVGAEDRDAARGEIGVEQGRVGKAGETEEGHARRAAVAAVGGFVVGREPAFDIGFCAGQCHEAQRPRGMRKGVMGDRMAVPQLALDEGGKRLRVSADQEERRLDAFLRQRIEHVRGGGAAGAVVEGERHFMIGERQRARIGFEADGHCRAADCERAARVERVGSAGRGLHGRSRQKRDEEGQDVRGQGRAWFAFAVGAPYEPQPGQERATIAFMTETVDAVPPPAPGRAPSEDARFDDEGVISPAFVSAVTAAIEADKADDVLTLAGDLHEADLGGLVAALEAPLRPALVRLMGAAFDFTALIEVDENIRDEVLEALPNAIVAEGVRDLESDDAVSLIGDLDIADQAEILQALSPVDRAALRRSLDFPEESAGRLMQTTFVTAPPFWTSGQTIDLLRDTDEDELPDSFFEVFIVDPGHRLQGTVFLDHLLRAKRTARLSDIMNAERRRVTVDEDREEVARLFARYNLVSVPVVDEGDRLVGVITMDDIVDVIQAEADEDLKALGGVSTSEELSDWIWWTTKSRFLWLFVNLITAFIASSVLGLFEGQLQKMVALAVLAPIVASQGGNAATQTMTVAVRALATRQLSRANALRIILRELAVGALNGAAFGILTGLVASIWFGLTGIGVVIAAAMLTNLVAGALGGILVPLALDRSKSTPPSPRAPS